MNTDYCKAESAELSLPVNTQAEDSAPISNIEVLKGNAVPLARPSDKTSTLDTDILLQGVCCVNGVPLLEATAPAQSAEKNRATE